MLDAMLISGETDVTTVTDGRFTAVIDGMSISGETDVTTVTDGRFTAVIDGMSISGKTDIIEGAVHHLRLSAAGLIERRAASCGRAP